MFAICPNHHAEVSRGLVELEKIDDCTLRVKEVWQNGIAPALKVEVAEICG